MTGRPTSATARLYEGDATAEVIDLRYPVRRRDERSEADRRKAGFPSYNPSCLFRCFFGLSTPPLATSPRRRRGLVADRLRALPRSA